MSNYNFDTAIVVSGRNAFEWCVFLLWMSNIQKKCNLTPWDQNSEIYPHQKNLWTKLNRLPGWKRVKTFFFYFSNKKKSVIIFFGHFRLWPEVKMWPVFIITGFDNGKVRFDAKFVFLTWKRWNSGYKLTFYDCLIIRLFYRLTVNLTAFGG